MQSARWFTTLALIFVFAGITDAFQENGTFAIKTEYGVLLAWNQPNNNFTLEIVGKDVRPNNSTSTVFISVDGMILQVQTASTSEFVKNVDSSRHNNASLLIAHRDWESEYLEGVFGKKIKVQSSSLKLGSGIEVLAWNFDMPEGNKGEARKQLFLTAVNGSYVIVLNGVVTESVKEEAVKRLLLDTMATFKASSKPADVKELQDAIRKGRTH